MWCDICADAYTCKTKCGELFFKNKLGYVLAVLFLLRKRFLQMQSTFQPVIIRVSAGRWVCQRKVYAILNAGQLDNHSQKMLNFTSPSQNIMQLEKQ